MRRAFNRSHPRPQSAKHKTTSAIARTESRTEFELTSIRICQCIERKKYAEVVEILRSLPRSYILKCLESFPFKLLNQFVPESFLIWETLFVKLNNFEEGHITPQVPCAACDDLVSKIGEILAYLAKNQDDQLYAQCRRVLKCVYMHYPDVMENLLKQNERLSRALYTLTLHIPLGTDSTAITLQDAIKEEVSTSLIDFKHSIERLEELPKQEIASSVSKRNGYHPRHNCSQRELQERLHYNNYIISVLSPCRRKDNLLQLLEMLNSRIQGDKEVLTIFFALRQRHNQISDTEPVEPRLRQYQYAIECTITLLKEIQNELAIKSPSPISPIYKKEECASPESFEFPTLTAVSLDHDKFPTLDCNDITYKRSSSEKLLHRVRPVSASIVGQSYNSGSDQELSQKQAAPVIAGVKKKEGLIKRSLRNSMRRLSLSTGNVSSKSKYNGARHQPDYEDIQLQDAKKELLEAREKILSLRRRERELTDR